MEKKIRIVTDSTADISPEVAAEYGIDVLPLSVIVGDHVYRDGIDLTPSQFYPILAASPVLPTTSQVSPGQFMQCFQRLVQDGYEVISIHLSQGLSSTVETARSIAQQVGQGKVTVFDSQFLSLGQAFQVLEAAQMARAGHTVQQIIDRLDQIRAKTELLFTLDTLEYLRKGGRIGKVQAILGQLLNLKPLIRVENGVYVSFGKVRSQAKAMEEFIHFVRDKVG
ncbi:MAG: DegV family protein, partial [Bacillota bacterium]